ncbi:quinone oxidoreductase [Microdochium trichocladiopsis]|uniref:Probable quinone oxidoreductase n=1 Tax=Microdochium trichocladiopsis TaxID=1682393 RepID=A0A9P8XVN5_9PEZI|nr:quinone oxidoreductase [Microdochium trichocladiopsis]KAH7020797.1 quinone oxidoreductase [Microdochium trichocladiopsis]
MAEPEASHYPILQRACETVTATVATDPHLSSKEAHVDVHGWSEQCSNVGRYMNRSPISDRQDPAEGCLGCLTMASPTMKAVIFHAHGPSSVLTLSDSVPKPTPGPEDVLIKLEYAGVNFVDTYVRNGLYPTPLPCTTGREGAGVIEAIGASVPAEQYGLVVGDKVAVFSPGSMAEYMVAPAKGVLKLPPGVSTREGAAIMLQGLTAWTLCRDAHEVKPGETVLVQAAAGGTGGLLVQMCKALGATVIGTCSSEEKAAIAKGHGADHVVNYKTHDVEDEVNRITGGKGCHAVFSGVGKDTLAKDIAMTRRKGTFVTFGNSSGAIAGVKPLDLSKRNIKMVRPTLANYITEREEFELRSGELLALVKEGKVKIHFGKEYSLEGVAQAQDDLVSGQTVGKLIVKI